MDTQRYDLPVAVTLCIQSRSGNVQVIAEPRDDILVEGEGFDAQEGDGGSSLEIRSGRGGSKTITVRCPIGTDVVVGTASGSVRTGGELGCISVTSTSGTVEVEAADEADLRTTSSSIRVGAVSGRSRMNTVSGKIEAERLGACWCGSMSGAIRLGRVDGPLKARTVSGKIEASSTGVGAITVKSVSGRIEIGLPPGTAITKRFKTLSGSLRCPFPEGDDLHVDAMTVSGSIELVPR
jgi:DUF4097 and DUF4098 domain-containing protein YvlB